jgi:hypothetical protein
MLTMMRTGDGSSAEGGANWNKWRDDLVKDSAGYIATKL